MDESDPKKFLEELQKEKKTIEKYIKLLEDSIIDNETKYLQNTVNGGNILRGWEHIFTSKSKNIHMGNQCKKTHISNSERLFSQTFEFDKNIPEEILNTNDKILTQSTTTNINNNNNNIKMESPKNNGTTSINTNNKHKKPIKQSLGLKRKRNHNINNDINQNDKLDGQKNS